MLRPPYTEYSKLFAYHLSLVTVPNVDDPDFIGAWKEGDTIVLFFHKQKDNLIGELCKKHNCDIVYQADLDYQDWEAGVTIEPFTVGDIRVAPVWSKTDAQIQLDPSVIFGSGFHPTTQMCLQSVVDLYNNATSPIRKVYDFGCGTGVLAIAAAVKGSTNILAVDYNGLACDVAAANAQRNNFADRVQCQCLDLTETCPDTKGVDLVMANLHHYLLIDLFNNPSFWQARYYIFSGFFASREDELLCAIPVDKLKFKARHSSSKWAIWVLENKEPVNI